MKRAELERGAVAVVVGVCAVVLAGFASVTVDLGNARQLQIKAQGAGDAGALAAAQDLPDSGADADATASAKGEAATFVAAAYGATPVVATCGAGALADTTCYQITGSVDLEVTSPYEGTSQKIHARVCEDTPTFFSGAIGLTPPRACGEAVAINTAEIQAAPSLLTLSPAACSSLELHSSADLVAIGGAVQVNSTCSSAITQEGSGATLKSDSCVCVVGGENMNNPGNADPTVTEGVEPVTNPYADVPPVPRPADPGYITGVSVHPGYWEDEVVLDGKKKFEFLPGIHYFEKGLKMEGEANIDGHNVLVYFAGGSLDFGGDPHELHFTPLNPAWDPDGTYQDIVMYQAPGNTTQGEYGDQTKAGKKTGSGSSTSCDASHQEGGFMGGIYFPDATIKLRGTVTMCATGPVVTNRVNQEGSSFLFADSSTFVSTQLGPRLFQLID